MTAMHLVIPFAVPLPEIGWLALRELSLPNLVGLLTASSGPESDVDEATTYTPPHERLLARLLGWQGGDGTWPWGAHLAAQDGVATGDRAWALLTPAHWHVGTDHVTLVDPQALELDAAASRELLETVRELFESAGFALAWGAPLRWYIAHEGLAGCRSASLDRAIGRSVDAWMNTGAETRSLRRLQNEVQMGLHEHPINQAREAKGLLPVNSFWLSGCGRYQPGALPSSLRVDERLRRPALNGEWPAWQLAWRALDAGPLAELQALRGQGRELRLTLCGERGAATWVPGARSLWRRLTGRWAPATPWPVLEGL